MIIDIFKVDKLSHKTYQIKKPIFKNNPKKKSTETETVYLHKNLYLIVDKTGNKECYQMIPKETKNINNNFIVHIYEFKHLPITAFPFLDKYDNQYERIVDKYEYKNMEFATIKENETLYFRIKDDVQLDQFIKEIS